MTKKEFMNWIPAIIVMAVIYAESGTSGKVINNLGLGNDSIHISGHFLLFFILCFTYYKATKDVMTSIVLTLVYSFVDEFHQTFVMWRNASFKDILVDNLAGVFAGLLIWKLQPILPKKLKTWLNI